MRVKTTPQNVQEANEALFRATMNLTFWEYLKYNKPDYEISEDTPEVSRRQESRMY